jgi:hypothetical protein
MPKKKVNRLALALQARRAKRAKRGKLSDLLVSAGIRSRYKVAVQSLMAFWKQMALFPSSVWTIDSSVEQFVEQCWQEGEPYSLASDALAGLQFFMPIARKHLHRSWKLMKAWSRTEPAVRATPFSPLMLLGFAGASVAVNNFELAAFFLVGFDTFARTGELFSILASHVTFARGKAIIRLENTKTAVRKGAAEILIVESPLAVKMLSLALQGKLPGQPLLTMSPARFRAAFHHLKEFFSVTHNLAPYSLRRGGATWDFLKHGSMERTLLKGRWQSNSSARIYLTDAVAAVALLTLTPQQESRLKYCARFLL